MSSKIISSITVKEFKDMLDDYEDDMEIFFAHDYGDYWNTLVAKSINDVDVKEVQYSEYHRMNKVVDEEDIENDDPTKTVLVIA